MFFSKKNIRHDTKKLFIPPQKQKKYPQWTFVKIESENKYYLLLDKTKMEFISERAFWSWGKNCVVATEESIGGYRKWNKIGFAPGTLIRSMHDQTYWFINGKNVLAAERSQIATPDLFSILGFDLNQVYMVSLDEVDFHRRAENINGIEF